MPIEGTIHLGTSRGAGVARSPIPGANDAPTFKGEVLSQPMTPQPDASSAPPADEVHDALRVEAAQARLARARDAREVALKERTAELEKNKEILAGIEARLQSYRHRPDLVLQDLGEYGVSFESIAEAVARGNEVTPEQVAAAEAAQARREVAQLRAEREQERAEAAQRQEAGRVARERAAVEGWKDDARGVVEASPERFPIVSAMVDRGSVDHVYGVAEEMYARTGRVPSTEEVLAETERRFAADLNEITGRTGRRPAQGPARFAAAPVRAADERRRAFLEHLDGLLKRVR